MAALAVSNHGAVLFKILRGIRKVSNRVQTLDFTREEFSLLRELIGGILRETALKDKKSSADLVFKDNLLQKQQLIRILWKIGARTRSLV